MNLVKYVIRRNTNGVRKIGRNGMQWDEGYWRSWAEPVKSQQDFRRQLVKALLAIRKESNISLKRRISKISKISQGANQLPVHSHELVGLGKKGRCVSCKGLRYSDRPKKQQALTEIVANWGRESTRHDSRYGYKKCDVCLCNNNPCFDVFYC